MHEDWLPSFNFGKFLFVTEHNPCFVPPFPSRELASKKPVTNDVDIGYKVIAKTANRSVIILVIGNSLLTYSTACIPRAVLLIE